MTGGANPSPRASDSLTRTFLVKTRRRADADQQVMSNSARRRTRLGPIMTRLASAGPVRHDTVGIKAQTSPLVLCLILTIVDIAARAY